MPIAAVISVELPDGSIEYRVRLRLNYREVVLGCNCIEEAVVLRDALLLNAATIESMKEIES
jgi:hypothetical protein